MSDCMEIITDADIKRAKESEWMAGKFRRKKKCEKTLDDFKKVSK